jgi:hypothetical protein
MKTTQAIASVARQVLAVAAIIMGALTSALSSIHLPPAISTALVTAGGVLIAIEHYLSDPSTGNPVTTTTTTTASTFKPPPPS